MRKCFVSRDVKRQHCLCDELGVIPCRLLFCCYVWTQFCMCRTKVVNIWDFSSITPPKKRLWWKWLNELISLLSVELLRVQCPQWKNNIWSLVKGRRVGGGGVGAWRWIAYACLSAFQQLFVIFLVGITSLSLFPFGKSRWISDRGGWRWLAIHFHSCDVSSNRIEPYCDEMFKITI